MSSDEKALEEFRFEFGGINKVLIEGITRDIELFIIKTRQEAREEERQILGWKTHDCSEMNQTNIQEAVMRERKRIIGLPCMKEEGREFVPWASCESDEAYAAGKKDGANFLRRELKEEINI